MVTRLEERLIADRQITGDGCWECGTDGRLRFEGKRVRVGKAAYVLWVGPIPKGKKVARKCRNERCYNPEHLFTATTGEITAEARRRPRKQGWHWGRTEKTWEEIDYIEACRAKYKYRSYR